MEGSDFFSHPSLVIYFFRKTGTANRWGTTNSKQPRRIIMIGQSEILSSSSIIFMTLFSKGDAPFTPAQCSIELFF